MTAPPMGIPIQQATKVLHISKVVVATDDNRIFDAVKEFGGQAVMTSRELKSGTDRVSQTAKILGLGEDDIIVNVQGDQPLFDPVCLDELVALDVSELEDIEKLEQLRVLEYGHLSTESFKGFCAHFQLPGPQPFGAVDP